MADLAINGDWVLEEDIDSDDEVNLEGNRRGEPYSARFC